MSNGHKLELSKWGDGTIRLAYWDFQQADDIIVILNADGTFDLASYDANEQSTLTRVTLLDALQPLLDDSR